MTGLRGPYNRAMRSPAQRPAQASAPSGSAGLLPPEGGRGAVSGVLRPRGSKSLAQRAVLLASVARGTTEIEGLSSADDVRAALALVEGLGVPVERLSATGARITGRPPRPDEVSGVNAGLQPADDRAPGGDLLVGESGTLARLSTALVALASAPGTVWTLEAGGTLLFRRSKPLFETLTAAGVELLRQNLPGTWPVRLRSVAPPERLWLARPSSSQEVSGLLLALAAHATAHEIVVTGRIPSRPYLDLTRALLERFRARVEECSEGDDTRLAVRGPLVAPGEPLRVEPDASSAAVALAAAVLSDGELRVAGLSNTSSQGDVRIVEHLSAFGCEARAETDALFARGFPTRGAALDLSGEPDLAPVLAAVAAAVAVRHGHGSRLTGLGTLPGKESDRLAVLAASLAALGLAVETGVDSLTIEPGAARDRSEPVLLDPHGDHRMAFAGALLGLVRPGVLVSDPGCVAKSWAEFWDDLAQLGARVQTAG
jgi:3-phosphoshikimate 1-carboxyvinyltransferase